MKIVIAGYGVEGKSNLVYFRQKFPEAKFVVADEREVMDIPEGVMVQSGEGVFECLNDADMVVRTAGLPPRNIKTRGKVWSATNEFFQECPAPIIGVTGTKGKGTTCSLIASILRAAGKTVHLVGNIGVPALDVLPNISADDIVVYELSSFQLWDLEKSPHIAVVLMIEPDHLDVHTDLADYLGAKANITAGQLTTDRVVYNVDNYYAVEVAAASVGQRLPYPTERTAHIQGRYFYYQDTELCEVDQLQLAGKHNLENACAAITAVWPWVQEPSVIAEGLRSFDGLPHRLKFIAEKNSVQFYDDSISTTPGSAIAAMRAFNQSKVLILGGLDKGADYTGLAQELANSDSLRGVVLVGSNAEHIATMLQQAGLDDAKMLQKGLVAMPEVVSTAVNLAQSGDIVILSPAAASFDQYKNYSDRGEQFVAAVETL